MINRLQLLRNVGQFDSVNGAANIALARLTLIYAENGRGKTTLAAILRSLGTNDPLPLAERKRLGAVNPPHVVLECDGDPQTVLFQNNAWSRALTNVVVFDDLFVNQNVYSGLEVGSGHRRGLHDLILGAQGVALGRVLQQRVREVEAHNSVLAEKRTAIPTADQGTLTVDQFCELPANPDIEQSIEAAERALAAARAQAQIATALPFDELSVPAFDIAATEAILQRGLPELAQNATSCVQAHFARLGTGGEDWVADGMSRFGLEATPSQFSQENMPSTIDFCPFCAQGLAASELISHYQHYFGVAYTNLRRDVSEAIDVNERTHGETARTTFERGVRIAVERRQFWSRFCDVPTIEIDTATVARDWASAHLEVFDPLGDKHDAPLERIAFPDCARIAVAAYEVHRGELAALNAQLQQANIRIREVKAGAAAADTTALANNLARLKAIRARHIPTTSVLCQAYLDEQAAKTRTEALRDQAREALEGYRTAAFPAHELRVNHYLGRFGAGFRLHSVSSENTRGGLTCNYDVLINEARVPVSGGAPVPGEPSFRNTLSAGDRNSLALAFFFACLDQNPALPEMIVVIDDPMTSLDEHRSLTTAQEIRALSQRASQVIVLAHEKSFLCKIWEGADRRQCTPLKIERSATGSTIMQWDVNADCVTDYDRYHHAVREYRRANVGDRRQIAKLLRPLMEGFLRRACAEHFSPGENLGVFKRRIHDLPLGRPPILGAIHVAELNDLAEYANRFHHETNHAYNENDDVIDGELCQYIDRTLAFIRK